MKVKKSNRILLSSATLLMCVSILALTMYVLFTTSVDLVNHLESGDLDVSLVRTDLTGKVLGSDGQFKDYHNTSRVDFSMPTTHNLFDLQEDSYIVPGSQYIATMQVINNGNVKFGYYIEFLIDKTSSPELCEQLQVVVTSGDKKIATTLSDFYLGDESDYISILDIGCISTVTVEVYFIDDSSVNNAAIDKKVHFDLIVHAQQVTSVETLEK